MKKLISLVLAGIMMFSVCCMSASAEQTTYDLGNGVQMILSNGSLASARETSTFQGSFSTPLTVYPNFTLIKSGMSLAYDETKIEVNFSEIPVQPLYISFYNETEERYVTVDLNGNCIGPLRAVADTITFTNLTPGHSYRLSMSTMTLSGHTAGTIYSK